MELIKQQIKESKLLKNTAEIVYEDTTGMSIQVNFKDIVFNIDIEKDGDGMYILDASIYEIISEDFELDDSVCQELDLEGMNEDNMEEECVVETIEEYIKENQSVTNYKTALKYWKKISQEDPETIAILTSILGTDY